MRELFRTNDLRYIYYTVFAEQKNVILSILPKINQEERRLFASTFVKEVVSLFTKLHLKGNTYSALYLSEPPEINYKLDQKSLNHIQNIAETLSATPIAHAGYLVGLLYTTFLPEKFRNALGIYYTPPALVERLIWNIDSLGFDWKNSKIIDPACGGSAFLSPIAIRIKEKYLEDNPNDFNGLLDVLITNLSGVEVDYFAAWISQRILELTLFDVCFTVGRKLPNLIKIGDALKILDKEYHNYDLVIGNPPFGKIKLSGEMRKKYSQSLFGHANLYGLFTHLAINLNNSNGIIAYVMPTSFLGGQYFKSLRKFISQKYNLVRIDFINKRNGIFDQVLQEIALVVFKENSHLQASSVSISNLTPLENEFKFNVNDVGKYPLNMSGGYPWIIPRNYSNKELLLKSTISHYTLSDYGFTVSTGQLVWNRFKEQLKSEAGENRLPLIWAECILSDGSFVFRSTQKNHKAFFEVKNNQEFLITRKPCILVQRTTAMEQNRRIVAAVIPEAFFSIYKKGVVIENHLNVITSNGKNKVSFEVMAKLLNSKIVDELFRCISGSVAVSAYELSFLPLPDPEKVRELEKFISQSEQMEDKIEQLFEKLYREENVKTIMQIA
ncbi:hypothetical protein B1H10_00185 [candidate division KSB1 bacterium 4484_188]|nr:MAG: hypothetical protein B1H10_00185 [candidate division KSB1 bacterium 4484_188]HFE65500.1 hypothetical protein [Caldithrix sp.]